MSLPNCTHLPLGLFLAAFAPVLLNSCDLDSKPSQEAYTAAQSEISDLKKANARLESEIKQIRESTEKGQSELIKRNDELQRAADEAKSQFEKLQDEAVKARRDLEEYMSKYKLGYRAKLKGLELPQLKTSDWQSFERVVIREVTPTEVAFAHSLGIARLPLEKVSADLQKKFLYDPAEVKREEEAKVVTETATDGLEMIEGLDISVVQKDPTRQVNPVVVQNLKQRILTRQQAIDEAIAEAKKVKQAGDDRTNIGKYRLQVLSQRAERMREEIRALATMLEKELNG